MQHYWEGRTGLCSLPKNTPHGITTKSSLAPAASSFPSQSSQLISQNTKGILPQSTCYSLALSEYFHTKLVGLPPFLVPTFHFSSCGSEHLPF